MIEDTWQEHLESRFPKGCAGEVVGGVELVELDSATAGYLSSFFKSRHSLSQSSAVELRACFDDLCKVTSLLSGEAQVYFSRLRDLTGTALGTLGVFRREE